MNTRKKLEKFVAVFGDKVVYRSSLNDYYEIYTGKKRLGQRMTKEKKKLLLELVKVYRESNKLFWENIIKGGLIKLACERLIVENKMKKTYIDSNNWFYDGNLSDVFVCMDEIVSKGCNNQKLDMLRSYCKGVKDDQLDK